MAILELPKKGRMPVTVPPLVLAQGDEMLE
jgi:hypothetical protein